MRRTVTVSLFTLISAGVIVAQPSLDPPAGPIEESGRFGTLIELSQETAPGDADSVFRISERGSYVLTEDILVPIGSTGIELASDDITIDLNGYAIRGIVRVDNFGISVQSAEAGTFAISNVTIRNGTITNVEDAVRTDQLIFNFPNPATASTADNVRIEGLTIDGCVTGIEAEGADIRDCSISVQDGGIRNDRGAVRGCVVKIEETQGINRGVRVIEGIVTDTSVEMLTSDFPSGTNAFDVDASTVRGCHAITRGTLVTAFGYGIGGASVTECTARRISGSNTVGFNGDGVTANCTAVGYFVGFACNDGVIHGSAAIECVTDVDAANGVALRDNNF